MGLRGTNLSPESLVLPTEEGAGVAAPLTRPSPPASKTGEASSPARPVSVRSGADTP